MNLPLHHRLIDPMLPHNHMLMNHWFSVRNRPIDRSLSLPVLHLQSRRFEQLLSLFIQPDLLGMMIPLDLLDQIQPLLLVRNRGRRDESRGGRDGREEGGVVGEVGSGRVRDGGEDGFGVGEVSWVDGSSRDGVRI